MIWFSLRPTWLTQPNSSGASYLWEAILGNKNDAYNLGTHTGNCVPGQPCCHGRTAATYTRVQRVHSMHVRPYSSTGTERE